MACYYALSYSQEVPSSANEAYSILSLLNHYFLSLSNNIKIYIYEWVPVAVVGRCDAVIYDIYIYIRTQHINGNPKPDV